MTRLGTWNGWPQAAPDAWVVVEKILEGDEQLPATWPVAGTTGYDWLNVAGGLADRSAGWEELGAAYRAFTGIDSRYEDIVLGAKRAILEGALAADLRRLAVELAASCERHRRYRDYTRRDLHDCLVEVIAAFAVYRTYVRAGYEPTGRDVETRRVGGPDRRVASRRPRPRTAVIRARRAAPSGAGHGRAGAGPPLPAAHRPGDGEGGRGHHVLPLPAPDRRGTRSAATPVALEGGVERVPPVRARRRSRHIPHALLATSTHDTKRSEDVRARFAVLAELPARMARRTCRRWREHNERHRTLPPPDRNTEWLIYQTHRRSVAHRQPNG